eukprot:4920887-Lingulodinium_polyedra.AAC.1
MAVHLLASEVRILRLVTASIIPKARPMASLNQSFAEPAFSHKTWTQRSGRNVAAALTTAGRA